MASRHWTRQGSLLRISVRTLGNYYGELIQIRGVPLGYFEVCKSKEQINRCVSMYIEDMGGRLEAAFDLPWV